MPDDDERTYQQQREHATTLPLPQDFHPGTVVPKPDPTVLTTQQLNLALGGVRDYINGEIAVVSERLRGIDRATELLRANLAGTVNVADLDALSEHLKTVREVELGRIREAMTEKFESIRTQFAERDTRQERESRDNKVAVDAAFAAQKEASAKQEETFAKSIDKSENATAETIGKLQDLTSANDAALSAKIDDGLKTMNDKLDDLKDGTIADLKGRIGGLEADLRSALARQEGSGSGASEHRDSQQAEHAARQAASAARSQAIAAAAAIFLVLATLIGILVVVLENKPK